MIIVIYLVIYLKKVFKNFFHNKNNWIIEFVFSKIISLTEFKKCWHELFSIVFITYFYKLLFSIAQEQSKTMCERTLYLRSNIQCFCLSRMKFRKTYFWAPFQIIFCPLFSLISCQPLSIFQMLKFDKKTLLASLWKLLIWNILCSGKTDIIANQKTETRQDKLTKVLWNPPS